ncbi:hypothetical protein PBRA_002611 [Plasmodiophora brassicae]|uniref:DNA 3'-5' helicase n=1 Tax=Plasmodiophora brassicae TaxID=37360 RepID=A0A0G4J5L9_PLABS|nr:hypothetical protein PBRA_002611 [Plasmodiophora brassicae]
MREAVVQHPARRLLVLAGPGTGKTHIIAHRIAHQIGRGDVAAEHVLALTFTERATDSMQRRLRDILGPNQHCNVFTFHAFATDLLRSYATEASLPADFRVCDPVQESVFLHNHLDELVAPDRYREPAACNDLLRAFNHIQELNLPSDALQSYDDELSRMFASFQTIKRRANMLNYADVLQLCTNLLQARTDMQSVISGLHRLIVVDECQDVCTSLFAFLRHIVARDGQTAITAVGDEDQSIFSFRPGALGSAVQQFRDHYPDMELATLSTSFRCRERIVSAAQRLIVYNAGRLDRPPLSSALPMDSPGVLEALYSTSPDDEALTIAERIRGFIAEHPDRTLSDVCVLTRSNDACARIGRLLSKHVPVRVVGGGLLHIPEIRLMVSFLIALTTPSNAKSLFNIVTSHLYTFAPMDIVVLTEGLDVTIPSRPGSWTLWRRLEAVAENADNKYDVEFSAECQRLLDDVNGLRKLMFRDVVSTVAAWCAVDEEDLEQFLRRTSSIESALGTDQINLIVPYLQKLAAHGEQFCDDVVPPARKPSVDIMTVHKAKGLEYRLVVFSMPPDTTYPGRFRPAFPQLPLHSSSSSSTTFIAEQRRLAFVALTRASDAFIFSSVTTPEKASRFVREALPLPPASSQPQRAFASSSWR